MYGLDRLMRDLQVGADAYRKSISKLVAKHIELHVDLLSIQVFICQYITKISLHY